MTKDEALDFALEALEGIHPGNMTPMAEEYWNKAITAIKQARSAPVQEPKMYEDWYDSSSCGHCGMVNGHRPECRHNYKTPAQPEPDCTRSHPHENMDAMCKLRTEIARLTNENARLKVQPAPASWTEMVTANLVREGVNKHKARELAEHFYSLAQRPFVGLTDEEISDIAINNPPMVHEFARAIEAKLKEKNDG
jgi:hypothetical protein